MKFSMAQIEFLCAYITYMMQPYLDADELQKLHHNAKIWTVHAMPPFTPVNLRSNHLTKEDLKHLGYNVGKFLRLQGGVIARFVKKVFEKPFESTQIRGVVQRLILIGCYVVMSFMQGYQPVASYAFGARTKTVSMNPYALRSKVLLF